MFLQQEKKQHQQASCTPCPKNQPGHALLTMLPKGIAHVVGCPISLVVGMSCGPIHCNKFAPVHLQKPKIFQSAQNSPQGQFCGSLRNRGRLYSLLIMWDLDSSLHSACSLPEILENEGCFSISKAGLIALAIPWNT